MDKGPCPLIVGNLQISSEFTELPGENRNIKEADKKTNSSAGTTKVPDYL